jgi:hypothetical protein
MFRCHFALYALMLLGSTFVLGCHGSKNSLSGNVTYEGAPINRGYITLSPVDGHGTSCGGAIDAGKYVIDNVTPGKKIVQIIGVKQIQFARSHQEMADAAKSGAPKAPESADEVPSDAQGNNQTIEITVGAQEQNFDLKRPARRAGR